VGRSINSILYGPYDRIGQAVKSEMQSITLQQLVDDYKRLRSIEIEKKQQNQ